MAMVIPGNLNPLVRVAFVDEPVSKFVVNSEIGGSQFHLTVKIFIHLRHCVYA